MRKKIGVIVLISLILIGIVLAVICCGKNLKEIKKEESIDNLDIKYIEYSIGGGFGTEAECATKTIIIEDGGSVKFTNDYNKNIVEEFKINEVTIKELENYINENREVFLKKDITDEDALDAGSEEITIRTNDEKNYKIGGYCVIDEQFNKIANKIIEVVGKNEFQEYCKNIEMEV